MVNQPQRPLTVDGNTYASTPGNLHVDYFYWIRSFPSKPIELIFPLTILVVIAFLINWIFGFAFFGILREGKSLDILPSALFGIAVFNIFFGIGIFWFVKQLIFLGIRLVNPFLYNEYTFCCGCNDYVHQKELCWCETWQCLADYFQELQQEYIRIHGEPPPNPFV
jgi:hypothetical protein